MGWKLENLPLRYREQAARQIEGYARNELAKPNRSKQKRPRKDYLIHHELLNRWSDSLETLNDYLLIELEGLRLLSINHMIGSDKRAHQMLAKDTARKALVGLGEDVIKGFHRFDKPVFIRITQIYNPVDRRRAIDAPNLYSKHLIDLLTSRGLGIFEDDKPKYVVEVSHRVELGETTRVKIEVETDEDKDM